MKHPAIVALICVALLIWVRSTVPLEKRSELELRLLSAGRSVIIIVLVTISRLFKR
jgi:hypothetical protein